jgi:anti-sigma regulatory factor (Ser/Thr protein kinase)
VIGVDETHEFASTAQAPALARDAIAKFAAENGVEEARVDIARLLGSELVTNAFLDDSRPPEAAIRMRLATTAGALWIAVSSGGKAEPPPPEPDEPAAAGMALVEAAASRWGVHSNGKTHVWFELDPDEVEAQFAASPFREGLSEPQARQLAALRIEHQDHGIVVSVEALTSSRRLVVALQAGRLHQLLAIAPTGEYEDDVYIQELLPGARSRRRESQG